MLVNVGNVIHTNVMDVSDRNDALFRGELVEGVLPHLDRLGRASRVFDVDFGLTELPSEPGILLVRGARQYGKSTWLEGQVKSTIDESGPGSAFLLNGDAMRDGGSLRSAVRALVPLFSTKAEVRRLFVDEITAVGGWEKVLKRLADDGDLDGVLVVTTGSRATDLRRGAELLPGRKGRLGRTSWLFTPIPFAEFVRVCGDDVGDRAVEAYLLSGGSPVALGEIAATGRLPEYVLEMVRDWIHGECARSGRNRPSLMAVMETVLRRGGTPVGQARLAREAGLANNTVAAGYVELLADLTVLGVSHAWDASLKVPQRRKPAKFPFINLLAAVAWDPVGLRSVDDFRALGEGRQGIWMEWLVAQELWRRAAIAGADSPEILLHWRSKTNELDFVVPPSSFVEVKRGRSSPLEFGWFARVFPGATLEVVGASSYETAPVRGVPLDEFLSRPTNPG